MKTLRILIALAIIVVAGCAKDYTMDENMDSPELKNAIVPIPFKGELCMIGNQEDPLPVTAGPDGPVIPAITMVRTAQLTGIQSHFGKLGDLSMMTGNWAYLDMGALPAKKLLVSEYEGITYGANGDYMTFITHTVIDVTDPDHKTITGDYTITGGSGKWENVTGSGVLNGVLPCLTSEGVLIFPR